MKFKSKKVKRGFTLIELVMVVGILGILSSIALVKFTDVQKDAKLKADYVTASNILNAAKLAKEANVTVTDIESLKTAGYLEGEIKPQSGGEKFGIDTSNGIKVTIDGEPFYPKPAVTTE